MCRLGVFEPIPMDIINNLYNYDIYKLQKLVKLYSFDIWDESYFSIFTNLIIICFIFN